MKKPQRPASANKLAGMLQRAAQLHQTGRAADAEKIYLDVLGKNPRNPDALNLLGVLRCQSQRFEEALPFLNRAVAAYPGFAEAHNNLGKALKRLDRLDEARAAFAEAVRLDPDFAEAHNNLGQILKRQQQADDAIRHFRQAIALDPDYALAHLNLADALKESKRTDEALTHYRRAIALKPDNAVAHNNLGTFLKDMADTRGAFACLEQAIRIKPDFAEAFNNLGNLHLDETRPEEAIRCYRKALELNPDFAEAFNNLGNALKETGSTDEAIDAYRKCISLKPGFVEAYNNLGNAYLDAERHAEALEQYRKALELDPGFSEAYNNLGSAYQTLGDPENALACYQKAVEYNPEFHAAIFGRGVMHLLTGNFAEGWRDYECRWQGSYQAKQVRPPKFPYPQWQGQAPAPGSRILVYHEQGFGDTIQFVRYLPLLAGQFAETVFVCQKELLPLVRHSLPGTSIRLVSSEEGPKAALEKFDWHCPLLSLPLAFDTRGDSIPANCPYLVPPPDQAEFWKRRLASAAPLRIGLAWSGNPQLKDDRCRSIPLARFGHLFELGGIGWFSLQKGGSAEEIAQAGLDRVLVDHSRDFSDFADTAAMIANLDLVISVDTAVAHLAGAMGKPVWLLNRHSSEWRWQLRRSDSPWYPSMKIFRQPARGDWDSVLREIAEELGEAREPASRHPDVIRAPALAADSQTPFEVAVVIPTILRPCLERAVKSVFAQDLPGRIQILIGVDKAQGDRSLLARLMASAPPRVCITVVDLGYSTSARHGGLYSNRYSGALRSILTLAANSRYVAYLDDDNWFREDHLSSLLKAIDGEAWAFSLRYYADAVTEEVLCVDEWESVGPDMGVYAEKFGGFVDTSTLLIDKLACHDVVGEWSFALVEDGSGEDRRVFQHLKSRPFRSTGLPTSCYSIRHTDPIHAFRLQKMAERGIQAKPSLILRQAMERICPESCREASVFPAEPLPENAGRGVRRIIGQVAGQLQPQSVIVAGCEGSGWPAVFASMGGGAGTLVVSLPAGHAGAEACVSLKAGEGEVLLYRQNPFAVAKLLAEYRVLVDCIFLDDFGSADLFRTALRSFWELLRRGGAMLGPGYRTGKPGTMAVVDEFAGEQGLGVMVGGIPGDEYWVIQKK